MHTWSDWQASRSSSMEMVKYDSIWHLVISKRLHFKLCGYFLFV